MTRTRQREPDNDVFHVSPHTGVAYFAEPGPDGGWIRCENPREVHR